MVIDAKPLDARAFGSRGLRGRVAIGVDDAGEAGCDAADGPASNIVLLDRSPDAVGVIRTDDQGQTDAHVEDAIHFLDIDVAQLLKPIEHRGTRPGTAIDLDLAAGRKQSFDIVSQPATGDMRDSVNHGFDFVMRQHVAHDRGVDFCRLQERFANGRVQFWNRLVDCQSAVVENDFAN